MVTADNEAQSPRVERLRQDLERDGDAALTAFWTEAAAGTPLLETEPGTGASLLTYLWRGADEAAAVDLVGPPNATLNETDADFPMHRVDGTDTWWACFRVAPGTVHGYGFREWPTAVRRPTREQPRLDPYNPVQFPDGTADLDVPIASDEHLIRLSVADTVRTRPAPAVDAPRSTVREHAFVSTMLGNTRRVWSYVPAGHDSRDCWFMLLHDGWQWRALTPLAPLLDALIATGAIPPLVVLMQECPPGRRNIELPGDEAFADAVAGELMPWVRDTWNVGHEPGRSIVAGQSYGGLNAAFIGMRHPEVFGHVLSQSGAFWHATQLAVEAKKPVRIYLEVGLLEGPGMVESNRNLRDVLIATGFEVEYREHPADHNWLAWSRTIGEGITWLTRGPRPRER